MCVNYYSNYFCTTYLLIKDLWNKINSEINFYGRFDQFKIVWSTFSTLRI